MNRIEIFAKSGRYEVKGLISRKRYGRGWDFFGMNDVLMVVLNHLSNGAVAWAFCTMVVMLLFDVTLFTTPISMVMHLFICLCSWTLGDFITGNYRVTID